MWLKRLSILNFKNFSQRTFDFSQGINCVVGNNGEGKTNLIDAIYYLSMCKSMLSLSDNQLIRHGEQNFMLDGQYVLSDDRELNLVASYSRGSNKIFKRNSKPYDKLLEHIGQFPVVVVSPSDTFLVYHASEERRRYLNGVISQLDNKYLHNLVRYNKVLQERNTLLKTQAFNSEILDVLDMQLAALAQDIFSVRKDFISKLSPLVQKFYDVLSEANESVSLEYDTELSLHSMEDILAQNRSRDMVCGHTSSGVHRDDLKMKINGYPLKKYGSQGQQKSFLVALKLAQYIVFSQREGQRPLLLLDDLFDKLDLSRLTRLLKLASTDDFGQIFITDCDSSRLENLLRENGMNYTLYNIEGE